MTPYEYLRRYRNLSVRLVNGPVIPGIDIHEYRNAQDVFDKRNRDDDPTNDVDNMDEDLDAGPGWDQGWGPLRGKIHKHGKKLGGGLFALRFPLPTKENPKPTATTEEIVDTVALSRVFTGKGTPELIATALRLVAAFGIEAGNAAALQAYCDKYIGLDCNGYVGSYLTQEGSTLVRYDTPAKPNAFMKPQWRVSRFEDVKYRSVLCWVTAGHVAIVDMIYGPVLVGPKFDTEVLQCMVCESTGARRVSNDAHTDGLNYTLYEIHAPKTGQVFKVKRGLGGGRLNDVFIGNLM